MIDPLKSGPEFQRELFERFVREANGYPVEHAVGAAMNVLVNALRQAYATREKAMQALDERMADTKKMLVEHYDLMGKRRNVFPFEQNLEMPHFDFRGRKQ